MSGRRVHRLMLVGIPNSPHLHRWARMIARPDVCIVIVPSVALRYELPPDIQPVELSALTPDLPAGIYMLHIEGLSGASRRTDDSTGYRPLTHHFVSPALLLDPGCLIDVIHAFQPQILHAHEIQMAGYVCLEAARRMEHRFPRWIMSNWGSDTALYHKFPEHRERLEAVVKRAALYLPDCCRDYAIARRLGYRGPVLAVLPSSGGMDLEPLLGVPRLPPSRRRTLLVKGYHNWAGRAMLILSAIALVRRQLAGVKIRIAAASPVIESAARRLSRETGLDVAVLPYTDDHLEAMARLAEARAVVGISISDGLPTTVLEAMATGALPIQSSTACVGEWLQHGVGGLVVSPHDTREIAEAIVRAMTDDALVESAARVNLEVVRLRWSLATNARRAWEIYDGTHRESKTAGDRSFS